MKKDLYDKYYRVNNDCKSKLAIIIQSDIRRYLGIRKYFYTLYKIILIQSMIRMKIAIKKVQKKRFFRLLLLVEPV